MWNRQTDAGVLDHPFSAEAESARLKNAVIVKRLD